MLQAQAGPRPYQPALRRSCARTEARKSNATEVRRAKRVGESCGALAVLIVAPRHTNAVPPYTLLRQTRIEGLLPLPQHRRRHCRVKDVYIAGSAPQNTYLEAVAVR